MTDISKGGERAERLRSLKEKIDSESSSDLARGILYSRELIGWELIALGMRLVRLRALNADAEIDAIPDAALLLKIGHGQVEAAAVLRFSAKRNVLKRVATLPISEQRRVADNPRVPFIEIRGGDYDTRMKDLNELSESQLRQVFDHDGLVRNEAAQIAYIERQESVQAPARVTLPRLSFSRSQMRAILKAAGQRDLKEFLEEAVLTVVGLPKAASKP